ncbi:hypothetical protein EDB83DRAFT_1781789 [Lactarius deliciosus]|nr:hypothetical protein EDB83DRAFT_1781789 [Lactarius deliciosus]
MGDVVSSDRPSTLTSLQSRWTLIQQPTPRGGLCNPLHRIWRSWKFACFQEKSCLPPRVPHEAEVTADLPFGRRKIHLRRLQFPVALRFAMTIDNAQGQMFTTVGVDLRSHYFAHGQLYPTLSRASSSAGIKCIMGTNKGESKTKTIVYRVYQVECQKSSTRCLRPRHTVLRMP